MNTENGAAAADVNEHIETSEAREHLERNWFWIALFPMASLLLQLGAVAANSAATTDLGEELIRGPGFLVTIIGLLFVPPLIKRVGIFSSSEKFRTFCIIIAVVGILSFSSFFLCLALVENLPLVLCTFLIYVALFTLSAYASCTLHKALGIINIKQASGFSGYTVIVWIAAYFVSSVSLVVFNFWIVFYFTEPVLYAAPFVVSTFLMHKVRSSDIDHFNSPETTVYFSDALFGKFLVAAFLMLLLDMFNDGSYYSSGKYANIFGLWAQVLTFSMPVVTGIVINILIQKKLWFPVILQLQCLSVSNKD